MKRTLLVLLALALLPAGFLIGYFTKTLWPAPATGAKGTSAANALPAAAGAVKPPGVQISQEKSEPLKRIMDAASVWRYQGGMAKVHVQYFVDYEEDGVKKRAFLQAFNVGPPEFGESWPEVIADGYWDVSESEGVIVLTKKQDLRTAHRWCASRRFKDAKPDETGHTLDYLDSNADSDTWDVFDAYQQPGLEPQRALVLEFDDKAETSLLFRLPFRERMLQGATGSGEGWTGGGGSSEGVFLHTTGAKFAGKDGVAVLLVVLLGTHSKAPATAQTSEAEVAALRAELAGKPNDAVLKWKLARAIVYQTWFLDASDRQTKYALAEEAVKVARDAAKQEPWNMLFRAELRQLLLGWLACMTEGEHASDFPQTLEELQSLVPLYDTEHSTAAKLLLEWKNPELEKDLPEAEKKRMIQETEKKVVELLRQHAEIWQNHPPEIKQKLQDYEKAAVGKSYAETPEFKKLVEDMRGWIERRT